MHVWVLVAEGWGAAAELCEVCGSDFWGVGGDVYGAGV